jgi:HK97 family phage portal protein
MTADSYRRSPNMLNWLSTIFPRRTGLRPAPHIESLAVHNSYRWPNLAESESQAKVYQQSPWVYIAVNRIAEAAALVPLRVYPAHPNGIVGTRHASSVYEPPLQRHPLERLLDAPNLYMSRFELIEQTVGMLELTGNAYWFLGGDESGAPNEIWPLRPDRVSIVPDAEQFVKGYVYEIDGQRIPLLPIEVIHFRRWHPANDYYGLSALEAARLAVTSDRAMAEWNKNTFGIDNGIPAGIVSLKLHTNDTDYERIKAEWRQTYGGTQRRTAILRAEEVEWQNIGLNHHELDFLQGRRAHRDEILNIFGIPVGLVSENATEANAKVAERLFIERTLWPKLVRLAQKISQELLPFWPGSFIAEFDDIRPTDTQARLDEIRTAYPVLSINEIRQRYYRLPATLWGMLPVGAERELNRRDAEGAEKNAENDHPAAASNGSTTTTNAESLKAALEQAALKDDDTQPTITDHLPLTTDDSALAELGQWERFSLKRLGRSGGRPFEVRVIPEDIAFEVTVGLLTAASETDVKATFASARESLKTTPEAE